MGVTIKYKHGGETHTVTYTDEQVADPNFELRPPESILISAKVIGHKRIKNPKKK